MASPAPNTPMTRQQMSDLVSLANTKLPTGPFRLLDTSFGQIVDWKPPYKINNRGAWNQNVTYQPGDGVIAQQTVTGQQYLVVNVAKNNLNTPPFDPVTGAPSIVWWQPWWSCYQRIRDVAATMAQKQLAAFEQAVSGPWPCQNPSIDYDELAFYYPDTGNPEEVTINGGGPPVQFFAEEINYTDADALFLLGSSSTSGTTGTAAGPQEGQFTAFFEEIPPGNPFGDGIDVQQACTVDTIPGGDPHAGYRVRFVNSSTFEIEIGGMQPLPLKGTFIAGAFVMRGFMDQQVPTGDGMGLVDNITWDSSDPTGLVSVDTSAWLPGAALTTTFSGWQQVLQGTPPFTGLCYYQGGITYSWAVNGVFAPGKYRVSFSSTAQPNNRASGQITATTTTVSLETTTTYTGSMQWANDTWCSCPAHMICVGAQSTFVFNTSVPVAGIHDKKAVFKIAVSTFNGAGFPAGLILAEGLFEWGIDGINYLSPPNSIGTSAMDGPVNVPYDQRVNPPFSGDPNHLRDVYREVMGWTINASTNGFWFGKTPPVQNIGIRPYDSMPWNIFPYDYWDSVTVQKGQTNQYLGYTLPYTGGPPTGNFPGRAYTFADQPSWIDSSYSFELHPCPPKWKPLTVFPQNNWVIVDSNGNLQLATNSGRSGSVQPVWAETEGAFTNEPTYTNPGTHQTQAGTAWKCIKVLAKVPTWKAKTAYAIGTTVIDANGNEQTSVSGWTPNTNFGGAGVNITDSNNNVQQTQNGGNTGSAMPLWKTGLGQITSDGSINWKLITLNQTPVSGSSQPGWSTTLGGRTMDGSVVWQLTKSYPKLAPAVARMSPPLYPSFWYGHDNPPTLVDPLIDPNVTQQPPFPLPPLPWHPFSFQPQGWWIYRVIANRIPQTKTTQPPPTASIPVTFGCVRNGSFVAFGTYQTGQFVDAMWPIFTNTALAWECSERVYVQAEIITCGTSYGVWGQVHYPMAAAYMNDMTAILNKLITLGS